MLELGHLSVTTRAHALASGTTLSRQNEFVLTMHPDGADAVVVGVNSLARVLEIIEDLAPSSISVVGARGEDIAELIDVLAELVIQSMPAPPQQITLH
jgi:hypothetical protein